MSSMKDLGRLLNGLSLIAKEFASGSPANQDFQTLLRKALVSATDIAGLTRGKVRPISNPKQLHSSVVHFSRSSSELDSSSSSQPQSQQQEQHTVPVIHNNVNATSSVPVLVSSADSSGSDGIGHGDLVAALSPDSSVSYANANLDVVVALQPPPPSPPPPLTKKRRPRERRVPSTSFSRALGFPLFSAFTYVPYFLIYSLITAKCNISQCTLV